MFHYLKLIVNKKVSLFGNYFLWLGVYFMFVQNNLKKLRKLHNLTQEQLGAFAGVTKGQISKLETGEQPWTEGWLNRMERAFHDAGYNQVKAWWFIQDPSEIVSHEERIILDLYSKAPEILKDAIYNMLRPFQKHHIEQKRQ